MKRTRAKTTTPRRPTSVTTLTKQQLDDQLAFLYRDDLNDMAKYLARGRKFATLSDGELSAHFVAVFHKIADSPDDRGSWAIKKDIEVEYQLRDMDVPFELIREDFDRLGDKLSKHLDAMKNEDPDRWIEMNEEINRDFQQFLAERKNAS